MKKVYKIYKLIETTFLEKDKYYTDGQPCELDGICIVPLDIDYDSYDEAFAELEKLYKYGSTFGYDFTILPIIKTGK